MNDTLHQHLMRHLGALSLLAATGAVAPSAALAEIPAQVLDDVADDVVEEASLSDSDRLAMLRLLAEDTRPQIRAGVADGLARLSYGDSREVEALLKRLASDHSTEVSLAAASALATHLRRLGALGQVAVVSDWASARRPGPRLALAQALSARGSVFMADLALEALAADDVAAVRREAVRSIEGRYAESPQVYGALLEGLSSHPERTTRRAARRALGRLYARGQLESAGV